jgi:hypothetical protein
MKKLWERLTGIDRLRARIASLEQVNLILNTSLHRVSDLAYDRRTALRKIAACETPSANGTVKRMARIARDALHIEQSKAAWVGDDYQPVEPPTAAQSDIHLLRETLASNGLAMARPMTAGSPSVKPPTPETL